MPKDWLFFTFIIVKYFLGNVSLKSVIHVHMIILVVIGNEILTFRPQ
jgi:hypothetical protein